MERARITAIGLLFGIVAVSIFAVPAALAALSPPLPPGISNVSDIPTPITNVQTDIPALVDAVLIWMFWILIAFSIIMCLVGGYKYVTSGGDPERVSSANKTLLYAAIAVVVAILAFGFPMLISSFFQMGTIKNFGL